MQKMLLSNIYQGSKTTVLQMAFIVQKNVWTNCLEYFKRYLLIDLLTLEWECCTHVKQGCCKLSFQRYLWSQEGAVWSGWTGRCCRPCSCWTRIQINRADSLWKCQVNPHQDFKHKANRCRQTLNALQTLPPLSAVTKQRKFKTCFFSAWGETRGEKVPSNTFWQNLD